MKPVLLLLVLSLALFANFRATLGLRCYGCSKGIQTMSHCDDFEKADESEKKARFSMNCPTHATGCAYMKFDLDNGQREIYTESLECYVPDARLSKISNMNSCTETVDGKSVWKVCACDTGDYCIDGEPSWASGKVGGGGGGHTLLFLTVASLTLKWIL